jgi:hypothetical protein
MGAEQHQVAVANADRGKLTVAAAQREIRVGSSEGVAALILGGGATGSGAAGSAVAGGMIFSAGAHSTTQRTLTVVVKFDASRRVRDFAYRQSSF